MYTVKKLFRIPIGHRLKKHTGRCHNIHGHNLKIEVQLKSAMLNNNDMVIDFSNFKDIVNNVLDRFDHSTILNPCDDQNIKHFSDALYRYLFISDGDIDPTAEVFCEYLYREITEAIPDRITVDFIRIWENDNSMAGYSE
ncbi:6-carboxytetrahydropterin synthase [Candidatus Pacearchaeota archaeon]|nr:6-carboxytetrahydropterin synthase [Candidatus Pacearchaeota archaeon]